MTECANCHWFGDEEDLKIFNGVQCCPECKESYSLQDYVSENEEHQNG